MILNRTFRKVQQPLRGAGVAVVALVLTACMATDDTTGSRLAQPPAGGEIRKPIDANDIAIVGQEVAHAIMDLPAVAGATTPPLVQFTGVTSIVSGPVPVDTDPYTELLRDRLLLLTREKLRFVEKTLPPLIITSKKGKKKQATPAPQGVGEADYNILAELRGKYDDDLYKIQVQFVDARTGEVLFDSLYRIRKEAGNQPVADPTDQVAPPQPGDVPPSQAPSGSSSLQ